MKKAGALFIILTLVLSTIQLPSSTAQEQDPPLTILSVMAQPEIVDRDIDRENSGADNDLRITIRVRDNNGKTAIDNVAGICWITIFNPLGERMVDNVDISSTFTEIDAYTGEWHYDFDPPDDSVLGYYDVYVEIRDETDNFTSRRENRVFIVDDLAVELILPFQSAPQDIQMMGKVRRIFGGDIGGIDRVWVVWENFMENFGPLPENTFTRIITAGGRGLRQVTVYACRENIDGSSSFGRWDMSSREDWEAGEFENTWFYENLSLSLWSERKPLVAGLPSITDYASPALWDMDGDNIPELFVGQYAEGTRGFRRVDNRWVEDFTLTLGLPQLTNSAPAFGDVDGDGTIDVIIGWEGGSFKGYSWTKGRWTGNSKIIKGLRDIGSWSAPALADITGDNRPELIAGSAAGYFYGFSWTGENWVENSSLVAGLKRIGNMYSHPSIADVDGDGRPDLISGEQYADVFHGYTWTGSTWVENENVKKGMSGGPWSCTATADIDKDGRLDLILGNKYGLLGGKTWDGERWIDNENVIKGIYTLVEQSAPALGDINGDGTLELLSGDRPTGVHGYSWTANGWVENSALVKGLPTITTLPTPALFDLWNDGSLELLVGNHQGILRGFSWNKDGENWVENSALTAGLPQFNDYIFPWVGDLDGDDYPELLVGKGPGAMYGYEWTENGWTENSMLVSGIGGLGWFPGPTVISLKGAKVLVIASTNGFDGFIRIGENWIKLPFLASGLGGGWPSSGDLDGDDLPEIITGSGYGTFYGFRLHPLCGKWTSPWYFIGEANHLAVQAGSRKRGIENLRITIETSDDALATKDRIDAELRFGFAALEIIPARYGRVTFYLETPEDETSPAISSFTFLATSSPNVTFVGGRGYSEEKWDEGVHENTRRVENHLTLESGRKRGVWTSPWEDFGVNARFENLAIRGSVSGGENILIKVEVSDDRSTIKGETEWLPYYGKMTVLDLSELPRARFLRAKFLLETPTATPKVYSFSVEAEEGTIPSPSQMFPPSPPPRATFLSLEPSNLEVFSGDSITITATLKDGDNRPISGRKIGWAATAGILSAASGRTDVLGRTSVEFIAPEVASKERVKISAFLSGYMDYLDSEASVVVTVLPAYARTMENLVENVGQILEEFEIPEENRRLDLLENAIANGFLGVSLKIRRGISSIDFQYPGVRVEVKEIAVEEKIVVEVESTGNGKTIMMNIENSIFRPTTGLRVLLDNLPIREAEDYRDVLDPTDEDVPEYLVLRGAEGIQVFVSIPRFSTHTIIISALPTQPFSWVPSIYLFFAAVGVLLFLALATIGRFIWRGLRTHA
ncbi:MAG: FG-GAP-like repeat-containing protein [Candidatus Hadarchaeales archaeon]